MQYLGQAGLKRIFSFLSTKFVAPFAVRDINGDKIDTTYSTKSELNRHEDDAKAHANGIAGNAATASRMKKLDLANTAGKRPVWFSWLGDTERPVYHNNFQYDPVTDTLQAGNFTGLAAKATADKNGRDIDATYLKKTDAAAGASKLSTARTISLSGDVSGSVKFDGTGDVTINATALSNKGVKIDLTASTYDQDTWYPVVGNGIPNNGYHRIRCVTTLYSTTDLSWSSHMDKKDGAYANLDVMVNASGYGQSDGNIIILDSSCKWISNGGNPISFSQTHRDSIPVLWLRGGTIYTIYADYNSAWNITTTSYTAPRGEKVEPVKSSPAINETRSSIYADLNGTAANATTWNNLIDDHNTLNNTDTYVAVFNGNKLQHTLKGKPNGLATLDASGKIPAAQLPSYVDDIIEEANYAAIKARTDLESGKLYLAQDTGALYRYAPASKTLIQINTHVGNADNAAKADYAALADKATNADKATTADNANKLGGYGINLNGMSGQYNTIPLIRGDGVMEVGKYIDFHSKNNDGKDYSTRFIANDDGTVTVGTINGTFKGKATSAGTADSATKATQDSDGHAINTTYLKLSGGNMTGHITHNSQVKEGSTGKAGTLAVQGVTGDTTLSLVKKGTAFADASDQIRITYNSSADSLDISF